MTVTSTVCSSMSSVNAVGSTAPSLILNGATRSSKPKRSAAQAQVRATAGYSTALVTMCRPRPLKAAATQARLEMQKLFGCSVHLQVWVKVKKSWSSDEAALTSLGYGDN